MTKVPSYFSLLADRVACSQLLFYRAFRLLLISFLVLISVKLVFNLCHSVVPPLVYRKDFLQDYLLSRAVVEGVEAYQPISELKDRFLAEDMAEVFPHPSPHPPAVIPFVLPFAAFDYQRAALIWLFLQLAILIVVLVLTGRHFLGVSGIKSWVLLFLLLLSSAPVYVDLMQGQFSLLLLLLLLLFLLGLEKERAFVAGLFLGVALAVKLFGGLIVLYLLFTRRWRVLLGTLLSFFVLNLCAVVALGWVGFQHYYLKIAPSVGPLYRSDEYNQSLWTFSQRIFGGLHPVVQQGITAPPLVDSPALVLPITVLIVGLFVIGSLWVSLKIEHPTEAVIFLVPLSVVISPVSWVHGTVLCVVAVATGLRRLKMIGCPSLLSFFGVLLLLSLYLGDFPRRFFIGELLEVSFGLSLLAFVPGATMLLSVFYLGCLFCRDALE